jgi:hypothetical protein
MLQTYEAIYRNGRLEWLDTPPAIAEARVIVTILPSENPLPEQAPRRRKPPEKLKGTARATGDIVASPFTKEEWEAMNERTARQLAGDTEAFE